MDKIQMGVIGVGNVAQINHLPGVASCDRFELKAICDIDEVKLAKVGDQYGVPESARFTDYRAMLDSGLVRATSICTPNNVHVPIALAAAERGIAVALEKPVAATLPEAEKLSAVENAVPAMVCFSYRFKSAARLARRLVRSGELGHIYHICAQYFQGWGMNPDCPRLWRFNRAVTGSGTLGDLGVHMIDLIRFITGFEYERVLADNGTFITERKSLTSDQMEPVDVDDCTGILCRMTGGARASILSTRFALARGNYQRVEIYGDKGALVYNLEAADSLEVSRGKAYETVALPDDCKSDQMASFAATVDGRSDGLCAAISDGVIAARVCDAVLASGERGAWVNLA